MQRSRNFFQYLIALIALSTSLVGCSFAGSSTQSSVSAAAAYCPYLPSKAFDSSNRVQVSGKAFFEYRMLGDLYVANGSYLFTPSSSGSSGTTYSIVVNGTSASYTCTGSCTLTAIVNGLVSAVNAISGVAVTASNDTEFSTPQLHLVPKVTGVAMTIGTVSNLTKTGNGVTMGAEPGIIRYAEVRVSDSSGSLVQCAETDGTGAFSFYLPKSSGSYTVAVTSRSNNAYNTAYVMNNPNSNSFYSVSFTASSATDSSGNNILAPATGTLEGGAFNILDQIYKAQNYIRTQTAGCSTGSNPNFFVDCAPFTAAPVISAYWTKGVSPSVYVGGDGSSGISFYLTGKNQLFIGGGVQGDVDHSDSDHFDNSVIVHEYGHFIEDNFGSPDSPGGSHNGSSALDPRLAWGEGWADFFQAAVLYGSTGAPVYRDTYGNISSATYGAYFNENLDNSLGTSSYSLDHVNYTNEGLFHEFSITRMLYSSIKSGTVSQFSEIWKIINGATNGMRVVNDHFKTVGRVHYIQATATGTTNWSSISSTEEQTNNSIPRYATPITVTASACSNSPVSISPRLTTQENTYGYPDQYYNNRYYRIDHAGGTLSITMNWSGSQSTDLDLYLYRAGYTFMDSGDIIVQSSTFSAATTGSKTITAVLAAGTYLLNVNAPTNRYSLGDASHATSFSFTVGGIAACPNFAD